MSVNLQPILHPFIVFLLPPAVDHSRVKLENTENDYINASMVVMEEAQRSYILAQVNSVLYSSLTIMTFLNLLWGNKTMSVIE